MRKAMSTENAGAPSPERWATFRFSVIGPLLAAPPARGELQTRLQQLAAQKWRHPVSGDWFRLGLSTLERWYYAALREARDPVRALRRKTRSDRGQQPAVSARLRDLARLQFHQHPSWSYQLHADNLKVLVEKDPQLGAMPSYMTLRRFFLSQGLHKRPRRGPVHSPGAQAAEVRFSTREVRSYQSDHVNALWHLDFHHGSRRVLLPGGQWVYPILLGILDDCSRLCGHAQWYLSETAEELTHGLIQAFEKRELPRALMSDNGSAMLAGEIEQGLQRLGIVHERTLPYSPYQNGKQEAWWNQIEGRLLPMLEGVVDLSLAALNEATLAWVELEYNRKHHSELGKSPLEMYRHARDVGRPSPSTQALQEAFTLRTVRTQRRSDGTLSLAGRRFEIPSRYAHFQRVSLRYASWDLARVYLADPHSGDLLERIYPLDKSQNAGGLRALRASPSPRPGVAATPCGMAPLLQKILQQYAATGLPPAYLPKEEITPTSPTGPLSP